MRMHLLLFAVSIYPVYAVLRKEGHTDGEKRSKKMAG